MKELKVFLGGTCNGDTWRDEIIPVLDAANIKYFNPVCPPGVNWDDAWREHEEVEKKSCNTELYVITSKMKGIFAVVEAVFSATTKINTNVILIVIKDGFDEAQLRSFDATLNLLEDWALVADTDRSDLTAIVSRVMKVVAEEDDEE